MVKQSRYKCSICLTNKRTNKATLPCKHVFCAKCITKNLEVNNRCPLCRRTYSTYKVKGVVKQAYNPVDLIFKFCFNNRFRRKLTVDFANGQQEKFYEVFFLLIRLHGHTEIAFLNEVFEVMLMFMISVIEGDV
jgi:hypothetical protein